MVVNRKRTITSKAPGRVCLFGDHQDYLGLPIIACAINKSITITGVQTNLDVFNIELPEINEKITIHHNSVESNIEFGNHLQSVIRVLKRYNCFPKNGFDIEIMGDIPINAGLSSSSAVVVAWVKFLVEAFGINREVTPELIAQIAYEAEVVETNSSGGKMDQYTISIGDLIYLETDERSHFEKLPKPNISLIIAESGIPKATLKVLSELKEKTWAAIRFVEKSSELFNLVNAEVSTIPKMIGYIPHELHNYFTAAIKNHNVTQMALAELRRPYININKLGQLMYEHHSILRDYLDLSTPKIEKMIKAALNNGAKGAKIVGSGKGGCIVALCEKGNEELIINSLLKAGALDAYKVEISEGAKILEY